MPLTPFQAQVALLLSENRTEDSHLAGGAALHFKPDSLRFSVDLDYFHDSEARVSSAFEQDRKLLIKNSYQCVIEMNQPGYLRCLVKRDKQATKVEWAHDSSWRFMPVQYIKNIGYMLDPIDLAINKLLALVGRDEARDFLDVHYTHQNILPLGAQIWAACGKDPGFNPRSLLELLKRRGKYHAQDFTRLHLQAPVDLQKLKMDWLHMLDDAEQFIQLSPPDDIGCLYYSPEKQKFIQPVDFSKSSSIARHFAKPGGILPIIKP